MENIVLKVDGMTCGGCVSSVKRALANVPGLVDAEVSLERKEVKAHYDPARVSPDGIRQAIEDAGYDVVE